MSKPLCMSVCSLFLCSMLTTTSLAETATNSSHHNHHKGNWMVGYKYKYNHFSGNKEGSKSISPASLMSRYGDVTLDMTMEMHMLELCMA